MQNHEKLNIWLGIVRNQFVGPLFIEENLNPAMYLKILQKHSIAAVQLVKKSLTKSI